MAGGSFWELPWHPAVVHFPVAFLFSAGVLTLWRHATGRRSMVGPAAGLLLAGVATFPVVVLTGLRDAGWGELFSTLDFGQPLPWHIVAAIVTMVTATGWLVASRVLADTLTVRAECVLAGSTVWLLVMTGLLAGEVVFA